MRSLNTTLVLATAVGLSVATVAHAQRPGAPRRPAPAPNAQAAQPAPGPDGAGPMGPGGPNAPRGERGGRGFGGPGGTPAAHILGLRQQLELTDEQVKKLEALQAAPAPKSSQADQMRAQADLMDAMQGDGNLTAARAALDKMSKLRTDRAIARLKAQQDARAVLTAAQKTKLDNARQAIGRRLRERGPGGRQGMGRGQAFGPGGRRMGPPGQMGGRPGGPQGGAQGFRQGPPMGPGMMPMGPRGRRGGETLPDSAAQR